MKRHPDEKIIYGMFDDRAALESAFAELTQRRGVKLDDISLLVSEDVRDRDFAFLDRTRSKDGAVAGGVLGSLMGGILAGMASLGALATGIGLLAVGPIVGLAAAGGLVGALVGHEIPEELASRLIAELHAGRVMMAVHTHRAEEITAVHEVFAAFRGDELQITA